MWICIRDEMKTNIIKQIDDTLQTHCFNPTKKINRKKTVFCDEFIVLDNSIDLFQLYQLIAHRKAKKYSIRNIKYRNGFFSRKIKTSFWIRTYLVWMETNLDLNKISFLFVDMMALWHQHQHRHRALEMRVSLNACLFNSTSVTTFRFVITLNKKRNQLLCIRFSSPCLDNNSNSNGNKLCDAKS